MSEALISVENLYKIFGETPQLAMKLIRAGKSKDEILAITGNTVALSDINLDITKGETFVVMGLSGSGKSTLIRHFNRLIEPTEGHISVGGDDLLGFSAEKLERFRRNTIAMVFQHFGLLPHLNVLDNVAYGLRVRGVDKPLRQAQAKKWLLEVGLSEYENHFPAQLSGGQQQRVGLARALCNDVEILLMDEPYSSLDPLIRSGLQDQLKRLQGTLRKTIVFITHDLNEALRLGDRIAILKDGRICQVGHPKEILHKPADKFVETFVRDVKRAGRDDQGFEGDGF